MLPPFLGGPHVEFRPGPSFCLTADAPLAGLCADGCVDAGAGSGGEYGGVFAAGSGAVAVAAGSEAGATGGAECAGQGRGGTLERSRRGSGEVVLVSDVSRSARSGESL